YNDTDVACTAVDQCSVFQEIVQKDTTKPSEHHKHAISFLLIDKLFGIDEREHKQGKCRSDHQNLGRREGGEQHLGTDIGGCPDTHGKQYREISEQAPFHRDDLYFLHDGRQCSVNSFVMQEAMV